MRILICNYEYPPLGGGGGVVTALLAEDLAQRHEVTVLTSQGLGLPQQSVENGVNIVRAPVFFRKEEATANILSMLAYIPMGIRVGKRLLKERDFDVINTHFALPSGPVGDSLSRHARIPNVLSVHGGDLYDPSKSTSPHRHAILRNWIKRLARRADSVVGQSSNTISNLNTFYDSSISSVRIPLGIERPQFTPVSREKYGFTDDDILLVTVGRLVKRKAVEQLVSSVKALNNPKVKLLVVGAGPEHPFLEEEARRQGVESQIRFMGFVDGLEKFQLVEMSDIYVSTSQHEGFGLVFLEAMHCGLPIICYDHGGQTDFLQDDVTGYLVRLNEGNEFIRRCRQLLDAPSLRKEMGERNRRIVEQYYIDNCARQYEDVFEEAIAQRNGGREYAFVGTRQN